VGHEEQFLPPSLSAGFGFIKKTFGGTRDTEQDAPIPDLPAFARNGEVRPRLCENSRVRFARRKFFSISSI
jgi:hypothetical protein